MEKFWYWLIFGMILLISEFFIPGFVIFFFGVAACLVSVVTYCAPELGIAWEILIFAVSSVLLLVLSRRCFPGVFKGRNVICEVDPDLDDVSGQFATAITEINSDREGKVEFRGSLWNAVSGEPIATGERVRIISRKNITLIVEKNR